MRTRGARAPLSSSARASPFPPLRFPPERERTRQHRQGEQPRTVSGLLSLRELGPLSTRARARLPPKFAEPIARIYFTPSSRNSTKIRRKWSTSFSNSIPSDLIEGQFFFLIPCLAPTLIARHEFRTTEVILVNAVGLLACFLDVGMPMVSYACKSTLAKSLANKSSRPFRTFADPTNPSTFLRSFEAIVRHILPIYANPIDDIQAILAIRCSTF